ncbi:hypothetical protein SAMN05216167_101692 [Spirosoma endophyticum]|uniref:Uncharacterized protein n=1 Tax=Spirosoma endophyticum TaxID=662367 RepID=A0A1I1HMN2_9BACT|nr:hypothetical protein SAMN05216167_101692 [Spirosoma endophyticum]
MSKPPVGVESFFSRNYLIGLKIKFGEHLLKAAFRTPMR